MAKGVKLVLMCKRRIIAILFVTLALPVLAAEIPSLPALMAREYNGSDLRIVKTLAGNNVYTRYQIAYKSDALTISGIMNVPKGKGPFPVIVTNHGYIDPAVYSVGRGLKREQDYFARHGYIVVHPDYRNHAFSSKDPDEMASFDLAYERDVINCILAIRSSEPYFDKEKIGMLGHSRGGGIALNILVARPDLVKACVLYAPMSMSAWDNFARWSLGRGVKRRSSVRARHGHLEAQKILSLYGSPETNPKFWAKLSAENYLKNIKAPIAIFHGSRDDSVPLEWSDKLNKALKKEGKVVFYYVFPGEKHEFGKSWPAFMKRSVEFFDKFVKFPADNHDNKV